MGVKGSLKWNELDVIDLCRNKFMPRDPLVLKGIGDDTAVVKISSTKYLLCTSDILIEGKHFKKNANLSSVGYKAVSCSLSDIAAMSGEPRYALVSVGIPSRFKKRQVGLLLDGIKRSARRFKVDIIGGDTSSSTRLVIDISMIGFVDKKRLTLRSGAKSGDYIFVTGSLGGSICRRHLTFCPRVEESKFLGDKFFVNAMIDISDGLVIDLWRILKASKVGAIIFEETVPVSKDAKNLKEAFYMGEDYELLFTLSKKEGRRLLEMIARKKVPFRVSCVGAIINEKNKIYSMSKDASTIEELKPRGFLHS